MLGEKLSTWRNESGWARCCSKCAKIVKNRGRRKPLNKLEKVGSPG
jgi:hypothetical protein